MCARGEKKQKMLLSSIGGGAHFQRRFGVRNVLHVPALASIAKFAGFAAVKKVALSRVLQKIGPEKAVSQMRSLNQTLKKEAAGMGYSAEVVAAADKSLDALETTLAAVKGDSRTQQFSPIRCKPTRH